MPTVGEIGIDLRANTSQFHASMRGAQSAVSTFGQIGQSVLQGIGQSLGQITFGAIQRGFTGLVQGMVGGNAEFERYNTQFGVLLGSAEEAKTRLAELAKFGAETPFELPEVVRASKLLQVMGGDVLATGDSLRMIGDAASGAGRGFEDVAMWVGRYYAGLKAGRSDGEALMRLREMGLVSAEASEKLHKLAKSGGDSAEMWRTLEQSLGQFGGMMEKQSKTFEGVWSNVKDTTGKILREIGTPLFEAAKGGLLKVYEMLSGADGQRFIEAMKQAMTAVGDMIAEIGPQFMEAAKDGLIAFVEFVTSEQGKALLAIVVKIASGLGLVLVAAKALASGLSAASGAITAVKAAIAVLSGPVGWVIAAAALIYTAWVNNWGGIRDWVTKMVSEIVGWWKENLPLMQAAMAKLIEWAKVAWAQLSERAAMFKGVWEVVKAVVEHVIRGIMLGIKGLSQLITGDFSGAMDTLKQGIHNTFIFVQKIILGALEFVLSAVNDTAKSFGKMIGIDFSPLGGSLKAIEERLANVSASAIQAASAVHEVNKQSWAAAKKHPSMDEFYLKPKPPERRNPSDFLGGGVGEGGGKKGKKSEAQQIAEEFANLKREAQLALATMNASNEAARLGAERLYGTYRKLNDAQWQELRTMLLRNAAAKDAIEARQREKEKIAELIRGTEDHMARIAESFKSEQERRAALIAQINEEASKRKAAHEEWITDQRRIIAFTKMQTEYEKLLWEVQEGRYKNLSPVARAMILMWGKATGAAQEAADAEAKAQERSEKQRERYNDYLTDLAKRLRVATAATDELRMMQELLAEGMSEAQAKEIVLKTRAVEKIEEFREFVEDVSSRMADFFAGVFENLFQGNVKNFFSNVISGFRNLLAEMAAEYLKSQLKKLLFSLFQKLLGAAGGGGGGEEVMTTDPGGNSGNYASGGMIAAHHAAIIGEKGPEIFVPRTAGSILPNSALGALGGGANITINVSTPDANSFRRSQNQIMQEAFAASLSAARRNRRT